MHKNKKQKNAKCKKQKAKTKNEHDMLNFCFYTTVNREAMAKTKRNRHTRKAKVLTIPELRSSMEYMNAYCEKIVHSKMSLKEKSKAFASEWKRVFGKSLKPKAAEDYIKNMMTMRKGKYTRKHRGGSAPLDYVTRPGTDLPYGNYTKYIQGGFWTPEPAILKDAATQQVQPQNGMGSNKIGGGVLNDIGSAMGSAIGAVGFRPFVGVNPMSSQQSLMNSWKGMPPPPGPNSYDRAWTARADTMLPTVVQNPIYTRELTQQGRV
jgi:hypothetical protein